MCVCVCLYSRSLLHDCCVWIEWEVNLPVRGLETGCAGNEKHLALLPPLHQVVCFHGSLCLFFFFYFPCTVRLSSLLKKILDSYAVNPHRLDLERKQFSGILVFLPHTANPHCHLTVSLSLSGRLGCSDERCVLDSDNYGMLRGVLPVWPGKCGNVSPLWRWSSCTLWEPNLATQSNPSTPPHPYATWLQMLQD